MLTSPATSQTQAGQPSLYSKDVVRQQSAYTAARFSLADPLHLIVVARYTEWDADYNLSTAPQTSLSSKKHDVTPYAGLVYDINNLFNKEYESWLSDYVVYGAPRSFSLTANYSF